MKLTDLHPSSKLWIYASNRALTSTEMEWLNEQLISFTQDWASHGNNLTARAEVVNPFFVIFAVDLSKEEASGCSIDKSVRLMKELGKELNVDFFNRLNVWVADADGNHQLVKFSELKKYLNFYTYDTLVDQLGKLASEFNVSVQAYLNKKELV
jgi:hypothetical protein